MGDGAAPTLEAGQLWRDRISDETFIVVVSMASPAAWLDHRGRQRRVDDLLDRNQYELISDDHDRLIDWWEELSDEQREEARRLDPSADLPAWMLATLATVGIDLEQWDWPSPGDPPTDRIPAAIREVTRSLWWLRRNGSDPAEYLTASGTWARPGGATREFTSEATARAAQCPDGTTGTPERWYPVPRL